MNGNPLPPKKEVALALLERGSVHVHLDPRATGVVVPAWFKRQPQLVLQVGLNMRPIPIPDLRVDEDGMSCTLSFNRSPFFCIVPWSSVYAMVGDDARGMIWPEDVPPEVALSGRSREAEAAAKKAPPERALAVVKAPEPPQAKPKRAARARREPGAPVAVAKEKKPRAKKPRSASPDAARASASEPGVLIPIPAAPPKPGRRPAATSSKPAAKPTAPTPSPRVIAPSPATAHVDATAGPPASPPVSAPKAPGHPNGTKPGGKPKREIPPYLRVVK
jgi:stringent starvation protein B